MTSFSLGSFMKQFELEKPEQREAAAPPVQSQPSVQSRPSPVFDLEASAFPGHYIDESTTLSGRSSMQTPGPENPNIHHYESIEEVPKEIRKYWHQRYNIWRYYDYGIWMTNDAWFGVTPQPVANKIAEQMLQALPQSKTTIIDAFAGAGGNAIAFAMSGQWERVFAIEKDPDVLKCARHNAEVHDVANKIWFIQGDCFEIIKSRFSGEPENTVIFASPPWGGPTYGADKVFDLKTMEPYNLHQLYKNFMKATKEVVLYLPRTSDLNQLAKYVPEGQKIQVAQYCMNGASKALCAYYGDFGTISDEDDNAHHAFYGVDY